ncbi:MAG TPA: hypothetical protein VEY67_05950 [Candidatus Dormibacteraeota bacterium]|nr:hypothetical protein [Candidatus Dormibacteraeota bacterium]
MQERTATTSPVMGRATDRGSQSEASSTLPGSPVDDHTYNVLQALASTLEAIEAYELYTEDDDSGLFEELLGDERRHAERLVDELKGCLGTH